MDKTKITQLALAIRDTAGNVTVSGPNNWTMLMGIIRAAEDIISENSKETNY